MKFDVAVIGSGVGGYPAALYLADRGLRVVVAEEHLIGGECTNYGCVPSKALYEFAESLKAVERAGSKVNLSWQELVAWIAGIVKEVRNGIKELLESRGVTLIRGHASLKGPRRLIVSSGSESVEIEADKILLALGTDPMDLPVARFDGKGIISNREAFNLAERPSRVLIVGGGVIGVELANMYSSLGIDVTIVELLEHILPFTDRDIASALRTYLVQKGVKVLEGTTIKKVERIHEMYKVETSKGEELEVDKVVIAIGRRPKTRGVGLETIPIQLDNKGFIRVNKHMETSVPGIYACGDVIGGPMLAHKALLESIGAAKRINSEESFDIDYKLVPITIFSGLEVASLGYTEKELLALGVKYKKFRVPLYFSAKIKIRGHKYAFIKILLDEEMERVLGIHIVSPSASEVVSACMPIYIGRLGLNEVAKMPYPHLTVSESLRDVAEYIIGSPIHLLKK